MSDSVVVGITGEYRWTRRVVWFWEVRKYEAMKWRKSQHEGVIRPTMIFEERRKNGAQPFPPKPTLTE